MDYIDNFNDYMPHPIVMAAIVAFARDVMSSSAEAIVVAAITNDATGQNLWFAPGEARRWAITQARRIQLERDVEDAFAGSLTPPTA